MGLDAANIWIEKVRDHAKVSDSSRVTLHLRDVVAHDCMAFRGRN